MTTTMQELFGEVISTLAYVPDETTARLVKAAPELLEALKKITRAFVGHLADEARPHNIKPEELCPCMANEVSRAYAAIAQATGEPTEDELQAEAIANGDMLPNGD